MGTSSNFSTLWEGFYTQEEDHEYGYWLEDIEETDDTAQEACDEDGIFYQQT